MDIKGRLNMAMEKANMSSTRGKIIGGGSVTKDKYATATGTTKVRTVKNKAGEITKMKVKNTTPILRRKDKGEKLVLKTKKAEVISNTFLKPEIQKSTDNKKPKYPRTGMNNPRTGMNNQKGKRDTLNRDPKTGMNKYI